MRKLLFAKRLTTRRKNRKNDAGKSLRIAASIKMRRTVFMCYSRRMSTRQIWNGMKQRCHGISTVAWEYYGARGITVCARWRESFEAFLEDMGPRPSREHSVERRDNDGGYHCGTCPECVGAGRAPNCRWATRAEQARNKTNSLLVAHGGREQTLAEWSRELGIHYATLRDRYQRMLVNDGEVDAAHLFREPKRTRAYVRLGPGEPGSFARFR